MFVFGSDDSNYGTEKQEGEVYHNGNSDPRGFGKLNVLPLCFVPVCILLSKTAIPLTSPHPQTDS